MPSNLHQAITPISQPVRAYARTALVTLVFALTWPHLACAAAPTDEAIKQGVTKVKTLMETAKANAMRQQVLRQDLAIIDDRLSLLAQNVSSYKKDINALEVVTSTDLKRSLQQGLSDLREQVLRDEHEIALLITRRNLITTELTTLETNANTLTAQRIAADNTVKGSITALASHEVHTELGDILKESIHQSTGRAVCATAERLSDCKQRALQTAQTEASQRGAIAAIQSLSASRNGKLTESHVYRSVNGIILEHRIIHEGWESDGQAYAVHIEAKVRPQVPPDELAQLISFRAQHIATRSGAMWSAFDYAASTQRPQPIPKPPVRDPSAAAMSTNTPSWSRHGLWGAFGLGFHQYTLTTPQDLSLRAGYTSTELAAGYYTGPHHLSVSLSDSSQKSTHSAQAIPLAFERNQFAIQYRRLVSSRIGVVAGYLQEDSRFDKLSGRQLTNDSLSSAGPFAGAFARWRPTSASSVLLEANYAHLDSQWKPSPNIAAPAKAQGSSLRLSYHLHMNPSAVLHAEWRTSHIQHQASQTINEQQNSLRITYEHRF